jgi:EAL domain-containing protein (putative c-di-GMP-specific phosphodiesterase class I)
MRIREVTEHFKLDRVVPFFQPIMDVSHNSVWRFECLARLVTPCEQTFLPSEFLHLVERQHSVERLTETIFTRSATYFRDLNVAWNINISQQDMLNPKLLSDLCEALIDYPNPSRVGLEITDSVVLQNIDKFHDFAARCIEHNIGIYIDHFGATPSNINSVLDLPISGIKIAGGLITQLMESQQNYDFVDNLTQAAHARGMSVVAVHVEDKATLQRVKDLGIRYAQGYYFSMPRPDTKPS